jgi:hypothetical protein
VRLFRGQRQVLRPCRLFEGFGSDLSVGRVAFDATPLRPLPRLEEGFLVGPHGFQRQQGPQRPLGATLPINQGAVAVKGHHFDAGQCLGSRSHYADESTTACPG